MTLRDKESEVVGAADGSVSIVGSEGKQVRQEGSQLLVSTGVGAENRDFDIESGSITDSDEVTVADPFDIGTTTELSGILESDNDEPFSFTVIWQADDNETELARQDFGSDTRFEIASIKTKSDHAKVVVGDESEDGTANVISGTLNFH